MKAKADLNALLLQAKNYERLKGIDVIEPEDDAVEESGDIIVAHVPKTFVKYFTEKILELVRAEEVKAYDLLDKAGQTYALSYLTENSEKLQSTFKK